MSFITDLEKGGSMGPWHSGHFTSGRLPLKLWICSKMHCWQKVCPHSTSVCANLSNPPHNLHLSIPPTSSLLMDSCVAIDLPSGWWRTAPSAPRNGCYPSDWLHPIINIISIACPWTTTLSYLPFASRRGLRPSPCSLQPSGLAWNWRFKRITVSI